MTGRRALEYLGLAREPGTTSTVAERAVSWLMVASVAVALFLTRHLDFWPQIAAVSAAAVAVGVLGAAVTTRARPGREGRTGD
jgi:hypothetical protein